MLPDQYEFPCQIAHLSASGIFVFSAFFKPDDLCAFIRTSIFLCAEGSINASMKIDRDQQEVRRSFFGTQPGAADTKDKSCQIPFF